MTQIYFNGVDGLTGQYLRPPQDVESFVATLPTRIPAPLAGYYRLLNEMAYPPADVDPSDLSQFGWGVILNEETDPAILVALQPLLAHRQSTAEVKQYTYRVGESVAEFVERVTGRFTAPLPHYLLIVAHPNDISHDFEADLRLSHAVELSRPDSDAPSKKLAHRAVGRIFFDTPTDYACYAQSVVQIEQTALRLPRHYQFFNVVKHSGPLGHDPLGLATAKQLAGPVYRDLRNFYEEFTTFDGDRYQIQTFADWQIELAPQASKAKLDHLINQPNPPVLVFSSSHGVSYATDDPRHGALLCEEWLGPQQHAPIDDGAMFAAGDVADVAHVMGSVFVHYGSFGLDGAAKLPQRLLSHPNGGMIGFIGYPRTVLGYGQLEANNQPQTMIWQDVLLKLARAYPIGYALAEVTTREIELGAELNAAFAGLADDPAHIAPAELVRLWAHYHDARHLTLFGDPAARLNFVSASQTID